MTIAVIGGGAAGFFAAIHAASHGNRVILLEKSSRFLAKVKVSGGGRCNVTNGHPDASTFSSFYPRGNREMRGPLSRFNNFDTMHWFTSRGVPLKTESDGRVFPVSDNSQSIIDCLVREAESGKVELKLQSSVTVLKPEQGQFVLQFISGESLEAHKVIVATGGSPNFNSYNWLVELGHSINSPVPSLFTFNIPDNPFDGLMGIAVDPVTIKISGTRLSQTGPMLFTHWGISGPAVLKQSAWAAREIAGLGYNFETEINFLPDLNFDACFTELKSHASCHGSRMVQTNTFRNLPARLWLRLCELSGITAHMRWGDLSKSVLNELSRLLTGCVLKIRGKTTFREEFVTCGGVNLKEVDMKTMESKVVPGLYFAGEVLDIDGITGGFNFQAAWTTGFLAGSECAVK